MVWLDLSCQHSIQANEAGRSGAHTEYAVQTTASIPSVQILFADVGLLKVELPHVVHAELFRGLVHAHFRPERLVDGLEGFLDRLAAVGDK
jgi:hypothetical protein